MSKIKLLIFDITDVISKVHNYKELFIQRIGMQHGIDPSYVRSAYTKSIASQKRAMDKAFFGFAKELRLSVTSQELLQEFYECFIPDRQIIETSQRLKSQGVKIAYMTNGLSVRPLVINHFHQHFFDFGIASADLPFRKPDIRIYKMMMKNASRLHIKPNEMFFTDDKGRNLIPARKLGWQTYLFTDTQSLLDALVN